jgi:hypothetical protein
MTQQALIARLLKIESLHAGATTDHERIASEEARKRILVVHADGPVVVEVAKHLHLRPVVVGLAVAAREHELAVVPWGGGGTARSEHA